MKKLIFTATMLLAAAPAFAQQNQSERLKLDITRADLNVIAQGVMKLPYETAAPILNNLQAQLNAADAATKEKQKADDAHGGDPSIK